MLPRLSLPEQPPPKIAAIHKLAKRPATPQPCSEDPGASRHAKSSPPRGPLSRVEKDGRGPILLETYHRRRLTLLVEHGAPVPDVEVAHLALDAKPVDPRNRS
jgi:hypothetical protein